MKSATGLMKNISLSLSPSGLVIGMDLTLWYGIVCHISYVGSVGNASSVSVMEHFWAGPRESADAGLVSNAL